MNWDSKYSTNSLQLFPLRGRLYFSHSLNLSGPVIFFAQQNVMEMILWEFQSVGPLEHHPEAAMLKKKKTNKKLLAY